MVCATRRDSPAGAAHRLRLHSPIFDRAGWRSESECHVRTQRPRGRPSATTPVRRLERDRTERCHDLIRTKRCSPCQRHASGLTSGEYIDPRGSGHKLSDPTAHDRLECCGWRITCAHLLPVSPSSSHRRVRARDESPGLSSLREAQLLCRLLLRELSTSPVSCPYLDQTYCGLIEGPSLTRLLARSAFQGYGPQRWAVRRSAVVFTPLAGRRADPRPWPAAPVRTKQAGRS